MAVIPFPASAEEAPRATDAPDLAERELALDVSRSWIVEAPAGSGKTGLLIQRYLKLLAAVDEPDEVLALTFTNKATAEMRERVLGALRAVGVPAEKELSAFAQTTRELALAALRRDRERGWRVLERPHLLNIRTIDSLCGAIARALPLLSGEAAFARPVADAEGLYRRAAHAVMMRFGGDDAALNSAVETVLLHRDGDLPFCEKVLAEMLRSREQWGRLVPHLESELSDAVLDAEVLPRLNGSLERTLCRSLSYLHHCFPEDELERIAAIARELANAEGYRDAPSVYLPCAKAFGPPGGEAHHLDHWLLVARLLLTNTGVWRTAFPINLVGARVAKHVSAELRELIESIGSEELAALLHAVRSLPPAVYPAEQWVVAKALFRLLQRALVELKLIFAGEGVCDFTEIALAARTALKDDAADLQSAMGTRLRHLLVDEMQDTSSSQYELLESLTAGWDGAGQTVFLVGDPKQSIYLFRQARVELFQQSMKHGRLGDVPLGVLQLSANFRSGSTIVGEFNDVFRSVFPTDATEDGDVTYAEAVAVRPAARGEGIGWQMKLLPKAEDTKASAKQRKRALRDEAADIAWLVREWQREHAGAQKIAVLTRARSHVPEIMKALGKAGVRYRAVEMEALNERREVLDVLAITRALLHLADRTAWLSVLRAPWCGVGVADLFTLAAGDDRNRRKEALRVHLRVRAGELAEPMRRRVLRTLDVMDAAGMHAGAESLAVRVERTWRSLGGDATTDAAGWANVRQFLRVLEGMEAAGEAVDAHSLDRRLDRLYAEPDSAADAVDVMTIHKAKGLEWDMVLVPGMHRTSMVNRWPLLDWLELPDVGPDGNRDVLLAPLPPKGGEAGLLNTFIRSTRRRRERAELKRVFYVAGTRARTSLHLFAWPEATASGEPADRKETLLKAAWGAAGSRLRREAADVVEMVPREADAEPLALAAVAEEAPVRSAARLERLPDAFDALERLRRAAVGLPLRPPLGASAAFARPGGSFGARVVGNVIHAFAERAAKAVAARVAAGSAASLALDSVAAEVSRWEPAMLATLRAGGLPPDAAERAAGTVSKAMGRMLQSADGRWILLPHRGAVTEAAWRTDEQVRVRLDRSFFAGSEPGSDGDAVLWIVDLKTGDRDGAAEQEAFLREEREKYSGQLNAYAALRAMSLPEGTPIRLGLFYPLMGRLDWWSYEADGAVAEAVPAADERGQMGLFG